MILLDLNQVMHATIAVHFSKNTEIQEDIIRHMVLNSIRLYNKKFSAQFGEMVIACDGFNYWRRDIFPYYKANRKKNREESTLDWKAIFSCMNKVRDELKEIFPYRVIHLERIEADDIIGVLVTENINNSKFLIISTDKDFLQLQKYTNVQQYNPVKKKFIKANDPAEFLKEHIIRGDVGDGIPNILSADSSLALGTRQKSVMAKKLETWVKQTPEQFCENEDILRNYRRNETLIDLHKIPSDIKDTILAEFEAQAGKDRKHMFNYFIKNKLKNLMEVIGDF